MAVSSVNERIKLWTCIRRIPRHIYIIEILCFYHDWFVHWTERLALISPGDFHITLNILRLPLTEFTTHGWVYRILHCDGTASLHTSWSETGLCERIVTTSNEHGTIMYNIILFLYHLGSNIYHTPVLRVVRLLWLIQVTTHSCSYYSPMEMEYPTKPRICFFLAPARCPPVRCMAIFYRACSH